MVMTHQELKTKALSNPVTQAAYDALQPEYAIIEALIKARHEQGITQEDLAQKLGTKKSAISRFEARRNKPTLDTLRKYAVALGLKLEVRVTHS